MFEANKSMLTSVCILLLLAAPLRAYEVVEVEVILGDALEYIETILTPATRSKPSPAT